MRRFGGSRDLEQQIERLRQLIAGININVLPSEQQIQQVHQPPPQQSQPDIYYTLLGNRENCYDPLYPKDPHDNVFASVDELSRYIIIQLGCLDHSWLTGSKKLDFGILDQKFFFQLPTTN